MAGFVFADEFLPVYNVSDAVASVADADSEAAWRSLLDVDLLKVGREAPMVGMLGWILLGERAGHEIALGLVGKFWRPVIECAPVTSADEFRDFDEPGSRKRSTTSRCTNSVPTDSARRAAEGLHDD